MDIKQIINGNLSPKESKEIIVKFLEGLGYEDVNVRFNFTKETEGDDLFSQYPSITVFNGITFAARKKTT